MPGREEYDTGLPAAGQKVRGRPCNDKGRFCEPYNLQNASKRGLADAHSPAGEPAVRPPGDFPLVFSPCCANNPADYLVLPDKVRVCHQVIIALCPDAGTGNTDNPVDDNLFIAGGSEADDVAGSGLSSRVRDDIQQVVYLERRVNAGPGIYNRYVPGAEYIGFLPGKPGRVNGH